MHRGHDQPGQSAAVRQEVEIKSKKPRTEEWKEEEEKGCNQSKAEASQVVPSLRLDINQCNKLTSALFESASGCQLSETEGCLLTHVQE